MDAKNFISHILGGKVLDVATGNGGFIHFLLDGLQDYEEIIGIDIKEGLESTFDEQFAGQPVCYRKMDAAQMEFADESFDTVCISNSLHHMPDLDGTLREMLRVLKSGGQLIIHEMYSDRQIETQMTHIELHHWWAAVDRTQGIYHNETFRKEELVKMVSGLRLVELHTHELSDLGPNPHDPEILVQLNPVIDRYIQNAAGHPELQTRGEILRKRLKTVGFDGASSLLIIGTKETA